MSDPFQVVRDFEAALCEYTGARYCVTTTSCTMALLLAVAWHLRNLEVVDDGSTGHIEKRTEKIEIPKRTYVGVPMSIIHAGGRPTFRDDDWIGAYRLRPLPVWDSARWLTTDLWHAISTEEVGSMICVSFHPTKHLGLSTHGGTILHDNPEADAWLRKARFDGRTEGANPKYDKFDVLGFHCYMNPVTAAEGLTRLATLPRHNKPLPNSDYPDLSTLVIFK